MLNTDKQTEIHLDLWKYFTDDAAKIKDRMWTIASWMFTVQAGLLAFIGKHLSADESNHITVSNRALVILTVCIGVIFSGYTMFMIQQYGRHIRGMWNRADTIRRQTPGLSEIWFLHKEIEIKNDIAKEGNEETKLPPVAMRLIYLCLGFMILFIALLFIAII